MKGLNDLLEAIVDMVNKIYPYPVKGVIAYKSGLMDSPLRNPTVAVGIESAEFLTAGLSTYSGGSDGGTIRSVPAKIVVSADLHIPTDIDGRIIFNSLSFLVDAFFKCEDFTVTSVNCGRMAYNPTIMCCTLPVKATLHARLFGDTKGDLPT